MSTICRHAAAGDAAGVRRALERGTNVNEKDSNEDTALIWAAWNGHTEVAHVLLEHGADATITDKHGFTPVQLARQQGHSGTARVIRKHLQKSADPWTRLDDDSVANVVRYPGIDQSLTSIFNFKSRERMVIARGLNTQAQSMGPATSFDALAPVVVEEALEQFTRLGGQADRDYVLSGQGALGKPKLSFPMRR